jgi:hypothetical protein
MKKICFPQDPLQPFQAGDVWKLEKSFLQIGDVGKLLVNYRHYKGKDRKGPNTLTGKRDLEKYLIENKAVLVQ